MKQLNQSKKKKPNNEPAIENVVEPNEELAK